MGECGICGEQIDPVSGYTCNHCGESHCSDHRLPENHLCGVTTISTAGGESSGDGSGTEWDLVTVLGLPLVLLAFSLKLVWMVIAGIGRALVSSPLPAIAVVIVVGGAAAVAGGYLPADASGGGVDAGDEADRELSTSEAERLIHEEVNERRQQHGLDELQYHEGLQDDARDHSGDMARRDFFAHENPEGEGPQERTTTRCRVGENIAKPYWDRAMRNDGTTTTVQSEEELAEYVVDGWMNSPGHRENILSEDYASEGVGVAVDGDEVYVTQMFCL